MATYATTLRTSEGNKQITYQALAEKPNMFSEVQVDNIVIAATTEGDTMTLVAGDGIVLTPNVSDKSVTVTLENDVVTEDRLNNALENIRSETYTVNVTTTWTADSTNGGYYQTVSVNGILATDNPITDIVLGSDVTANKTYKKAWALVDRITTEENSITLYANEGAPVTAFTIQLKVVR